MPTLLRPRWIVPVIPRQTVLTDAALVLDGERIAAIGPYHALKARYPGVAELALPEHVLLPGLVNLHAHSAMSLLRGYADDLTLMDWLQQHIWPAEARHVADEFVYDGALLAMAEMLRSGATTVNDMYFFHDAVARAGLSAGMRTVVGASILEFPTPFARNADDYLAKALAHRDRWQGEPLLGFTLAPHAPYTVSDATFRRVITLAEQVGCGVHCHVHETAQEIGDSLREHGVRPLQRLQQLGLLGPNLIAAHMVHANAAEIELLARHGVHVAHNPASNLKLASGIAPVRDLLRAGVNVGVGSDGAASNNRLDLLAELRLAALLAKAQSGDPTAVPAFAALEMATLNGAQALGLADQIGSLEAGKLADLIAVDLSAIESQPCYDPVSTLVYASGREAVSHVWVAGRCLLEQRRLTRLELPQLVAKARWWQAKIAANRTPAGPESPL